MSKYGVFFWSVFSGIWNGYEDLLRKSPYLVHIRENTDQKKTPYLDSFHVVFLLKTTINYLLYRGKVSAAFARPRTDKTLNFSWII